MQLCNSDDLGPSQQTISRVIKETLDALSSRPILAQFINFPITPQETQRKKIEFMQIAGFPGVIGVIDGKHIRITSPKEFAAEYVNRKRYHSINTLIVFDAKYKVIDIVANWPGSAHDARILNERGLNRFVFGRGIVPDECHLLGDSGYPSKKWLLTPYIRPQPGPQSNYNRCHKKTRSVVERGIAKLKRRFHVSALQQRCARLLKYMYVHNICKDRNIGIPAGEDHNNGEEDDAQQPLEPPLQPAAWPREGILYRDQFVNLHFNNDE
ncbi:hypothetical protein Pmani_000185 [Petrolisthes manimaculis]|uniref:DDE Tnp4 domain-containing protein n=1 Tax=Petrolisthes manimaculis TaxID=1843537 RepID=A0AAE1QQK0_9EUCA|nr:hypothetical protein Pmani_000185 [Petrolisthes manimaculis]